MQKDNLNTYVQQKLFSLPDTNPLLGAVATCNSCEHRQRWECNSKVFQYCGIRKSNRTENGLLKIKCKDAACPLYNPAPNIKLTQMKSERRKIFEKNVALLLNGIVYEKKIVKYNMVDDEFTIFIYFGKRKTLIIEAIFTLKSTYYFGSMNAEKKKNLLKKTKSM